jgi:hypothetical protein
MDNENVETISQISEKVKPHQIVINILTKVEDIIPKWKIVPTKDVINLAFKDPAKRERVRFFSLIIYKYVKFLYTLKLKLLPLTMIADKEKQADIPGQAQVKNSTRNVKNQHES